MGVTSYLCGRLGSQQFGFLSSVLGGILQKARASPRCERDQTGLFKSSYYLFTLVYEALWCYNIIPSVLCDMQCAIITR